MKRIEHRRHAMRKKPFPHLSQAGVDLAKQVGQTMGKFDYVVTSTLPRAAETAVAMGFGIDEENAMLSHMSDAISKEVAWDAGFKIFYEAYKTQGRLAAYAQNLKTLILQWLEKVPEGGSLLIVSHGGIVEASLYGCLQDEETTRWGKFIDYCEGLSFSFEGGKFFAPHIHRV